MPKCYCSKSILSIFLFLPAIQPPFVQSWTPAVSPRQSSSSMHSWHQQAGRRNGYDADFYDEDDDCYYESSRRRNTDSYWEDDGETSATPPREGGFYNVRFDSYEEEELEWESVGNAGTQVLLPIQSKPTTIVHFCGGTFFGSAPKLWYRQLLEGLVRNTQCAVIATPIPVTFFNSPLQHIELCQTLRREFMGAWRDVLEDEYSAAELQDIPVAGLGHSLGARLLVVLATLQKGIPYKSFILLSFINYGASAGIPGLSTLLKQSRQTEAANKEPSKNVKRNRRRYDDFYDDDDDDDDDWGSIFDDLQAVVKEQAFRVKTALTPRSDDLEFYPTPDQLWNALQEDQRYQVPQTLLVQFDDDDVDQSSKLAQVLVATNSSDVKFARLRGTHLTPVSAEGEQTNGNASWKLPTKALWKLLRGRTLRTSTEVSMRNLRQSIARYITDIVTK